MTLLRDKILTLKRKYKYVTKDRCFYNDVSELKKATGRIDTFSIVESEKHGVFIFEFPFTRRQNLTYNQWATYLHSGLKKGHASLEHILTNIIMGNIGAKYNDSWRLVEFIGWRLDPRGIRQSGNSKMVAKSKTRNARKKPNAKR